MTKPTDKKPDQKQISCPKCGSNSVRRDVFNRINIGCMLVNVMAFATFMENKRMCARVCRECGYHFEG